MKGTAKKGSILDTLLLLIFPLILLVVIVAAYFGYTTLADTLSATQSDIAGYSEARDLVVHESERFVSWWDFLVVGLIFGLWLITLIVSWILGNNPIFVIIYILLAIFSVAVAVGITYMAQFVLSMDALSGFVASFPMTTAVINWLLPIDILFIITNGAALYLKQKTGQEVAYG